MQERQKEKGKFNKYKERESIRRMLDLLKGCKRLI